MPDWIYAIILGLLEGLTEFLPVSSTGHLLLTKEALGLKGQFWGTFSVLIQLGAILAVITVYFRRLLGVVLGLGSDPAARRFAISILIAFFPAVVLGLAFHDIIKTVLFESPRLICMSLILGGIVLLLIDRFVPPPKQHDPMALTWKTAFGIGLFQCVAMIPGVSRSGATIVGSMMMGVEKRAAAEFSFFLAIPTMIGAFTLDAWESRSHIDAGNVWVIALGFVVAFLTASVVIRTLLDVVTKRGYAPFGWWRILVGGVGLVLLSVA